MYIIIIHKTHQGGRSINSSVIIMIMYLTIMEEHNYISIVLLSRVLLLLLGYQSLSWLSIKLISKQRPQGQRNRGNGFLEPNPVLRTWGKGFLEPGQRVLRTKPIS